MGTCSSSCSQRVKTASFVTIVPLSIINDMLLSSINVAQINDNGIVSSLVKISIVPNNTVIYREASVTFYGNDQHIRYYIIVNGQQMDIILDSSIRYNSIMRPLEGQKN
jgi:hypothetical protein